MSLLLCGSCCCLWFCISGFGKIQVNDRSAVDAMVINVITQSMLKVFALALKHFFFSFYTLRPFRVFKEFTNKHLNFYQYLPTNKYDNISFFFNWVYPSRVHLSRTFLSLFVWVLYWQLSRFIVYVYSYSYIYIYISLDFKIFSMCAFDIYIHLWTVQFLLICWICSCIYIFDILFLG